MIGVFDSGHGGLTVLKGLADRFPNQNFLYLGDHINAPYGNRSSEEIVELTRRSVETLFEHGCGLVVLGCNTATAIACRSLQQDWLPQSKWQGRNVLGIIAPTVEVATQTPWGMTEPQYPQMYKEDVIAVFGTQRTIDSMVYDEEIKKRCPQIDIVGKACPDLVTAIEGGDQSLEIDSLVKGYVTEMLAEAADKTDGKQPHYAILGCTHYPLVEPLFAKYLPASCRVLSQPTIVAQALEHYLKRHPHFSTKRAEGANEAARRVQLLTTGDVAFIEQKLTFAWPGRPRFELLAEING